MSTRNTGSFPQRPFSYQIQLSTANSNYTAPTTPGLLYQAPPDGGDIWDISVTPTATVTTANQMQFFGSPDGGTTFNLLPFGAVMATYTMAQTTALPITHMPHPNGVPMGPTNPWIVPGVPGAFTNTMSLSQLTDASNFYVGQVPTGGTVNAQTLALAYNTSGTQLAAAPATGTILDFVAGLTNTAATTIAPGLQAATAIKRAASTGLSAGDITAPFRYRAVFDGTEWILLLGYRIYFAMGQAQAVVASITGADR